MSRLHVLACASVLSLAAAASSPVSAQQIDRIVAFGDSYADPGNAFALGYANPQALAVYPTGRFSGGSNYIDTLSNILQVPVDNFAIGGAMSGTNNTTLCFDAVYGAPLCGKGFQYEIDQFLNVGTQSAVFPNAAPLGPGDLVTVNIGANDARLYQQTGGTLANAPATGTAAAVATSAQLDRLVVAGAPTISYIAGDAGRLPEILTQPSLAAIRSAYSTAFNTRMQTTLAGYASNGVIVHYLDLNIVGNNIAANPTAYGITNGQVCPIFPNTTCVVNSNGYLFYGDALHLTSQGFAIVAHYVAAQLAAPLTLQAPSETGYETAKQWGRTLSSRGDLYGRNGDGAAGLRVWAVGDGFWRDVKASSETSAFTVKGLGGSVGVEYGMPNAVIGIAGNYTRPRASFGNDAARLRARSWQVGAYGSMEAGGLFGQAYAGYGRDRNRITRAGVVDSMTASPHGSHIIFGAKGGYLMDFAGLRAGPIVAADYARAKVDSYTESGDAALTLNVGRQSLKSTIGQAGLEVRGEIAGLHPYVDLVAEHDFTGNDRHILFAQTSATTIVNTWTVNRGKDTYARLSGGASASLSGNISLDAAFSTTFSRDDGQEVSGQLGLKAKF